MIDEALAQQWPRWLGQRNGNFPEPPLADRKQRINISKNPDLTALIIREALQS
jgi:hypothetical protein